MIDQDKTIQERISIVSGQLATNLNSFIEDSIDQYKQSFPDNPSVTYTITIDTLAVYIGQLINTFPKDTRDDIIHHTVDVILTAQHKLAKTDSDTHHQVGHA